MAAKCSATAVWIALPAVFFLACGDSKEPRKGQRPNRPPIVSVVSIQPNLPVRGQNLTALVTASDPDGDRVSLTFRWEVNGQSVPGEERSMLEASHLRPGDRVVVWVTAGDGKASTGEVSSAPVQVRETAPQVVGVELDPRPAFPGDRIRAKVFSRDREATPENFGFTWMVNGQEVAGESTHFLSTERLRRGDRIAVQVLPERGGEQGPLAESEELVLENRPPRILSQPPERLAAPGRYRYAVRAEDPDGDRLSFRLEGNPPPGMRIDPSSGVLEWSLGAPPEDSVTVDIRVTDGLGGEAQQSWELSIPAPS
jgi:hypothetical protein